MQIRRLVKSGAASHTVSLPKSWLEKNKLEKGNLVYITEEDNKIMISCDKDNGEEEMKEISINIDAKDIGTVRRETISAYIKNYQLFTFIGETLSERLEDIRKVLNNFLALEVTEQTATKLVAKDFLNLSEFSIENTVRRMDMLTRSIIEDAKKGKSEAKALGMRDFEVDKLFFLMSRLIRANLSSPSPQIKNVDAMSIWWLSKSLESIADSAKNLSYIYSKDISQVYEEVEQFYLECAKAYFKKDRKLADEMIARRPSVLDKIDSLKDEKAKHKLKDMVNFSRNVSKIILDMDQEK